MPVTAKLAWLNGWLASRLWLSGDSFAVADACRPTVLRWTPRVLLERSRWAALLALQGRSRSVPPMQEALQAEGLQR